MTVNDPLKLIRDKIDKLDTKIMALVSEREVHGHLARA